MKQRVIFKVLLYTYKALHAMAPEYLSNLLTPYVPRWSLRSASMDYLVVPQTRLRLYGDRAFMAAAPKLWNDLPPDVKSAPTIESFKTKLKTHLFLQAFGDEHCK